MKKMFVALCMAGALAGLSSCKTAQSAASTLEALDGEWKITTVEGQAITPKPGEAEAFIGFNVKEKRVYGNSGCNRLTSALQADAKKGTFTFGAAASTQMMCPDMDTEQKVLTAMGKVTGYEITKDGKLVFKAEDGKAVMTLEKK